MFSTCTAIDVRYPDVDAMGIVHHAVYPIWYEIARMDFFDKAGLGYERMHPHGVDPAMVNLNMNYAAPVRYPGKVWVSTKVRSYAPRKLELEYEVALTEGGKSVATATSFHIWTGPDFKAYNVQENLPEIYDLIIRAAE